MFFVNFAILINILTFVQATQSVNRIDSVTTKSSLWPQTNMNVTFLLFTNQNRDEPQVFNSSSNDSQIESSSFRSDRKTKLIVHGWMSNFQTSPWMTTMKDYFLDYSDYNIIAVTYLLKINYLEAATNTRIVGKGIADFIKRLIDIKSISVNDIHCIGHSLGAHICGFAGKYFRNPRFAQISGLDPAAPAFITNDTTMRLAVNDADLVVVMHTAAGIVNTEESNPVDLTGILGYPSNLGDFDFWPNGGSQQPGCKLNDDSKDIVNNRANLIDYIPCSHMRATVLPTSLNTNDCKFIGYQCESYAMFKDGLCADCGSDGSKCKPIDFSPHFWENFDKTSLKSGNNFGYFLETGSKEPFCMFHYQIKVEIEKRNYFTMDGQLEITHPNDNRVVFTKSFSPLYSIASQINSRQLDFESETKRTQLYVDSSELEPTDNVSVKWTANLFDELKVKKISFKYMNSFDTRVRHLKSYQFCPKSGQKLWNGNTVLFRKC